jgi:hypothetical protein
MDIGMNMDIDILREYEHEDELRHEYGNEHVRSTCEYVHIRLQ